MIVFAMSIGFAAAPAVAASTASAESTPAVPRSIAEPAMHAHAPVDARRDRLAHGAAREGWFCPIGTCGPRPAGAAIRTAIAFGMAAGVAGLIARRRSDRPA